MPDATSVNAAFEAFPDEVRPILGRLREIILEVAATSKGVGEIEETLKWGQPSYLTKRPKSGTTIRLGVTKSGKPALFTHCQTTVVSDFQSHFPNDLTYEGNRAVIIENLDATEPLLRQFISSAMTYHLKT